MTPWCERADAVTRDRFSAGARCGVTRNRYTVLPTDVHGIGNAVQRGNDRVWRRASTVQCRAKPVQHDAFTLPAKENRPGASGGPAWPAALVAQG